MKLNNLDYDLPVGVKCHRCGYVWATKSKLIKISCPSCQIKVTNPSA